MSDLPQGWEWATIGEVADVAGGIQKSPKRLPAANAYPMLRVANVFSGRLDLDEVHEIELFEGELDRLRLEPGDCLVVEGNGSIAQVGRAATWRGQIPECVHQNHILRARPLINPSYLAYWLQSPVARAEIEKVTSSTSGLHVLSGRKLNHLPIPLPGLSEQKRIVVAVEEYLSHLDAAEASLRSSQRRMQAFDKSILAQAQPRSDGELMAMDDLLVGIETGRSFKTPGRRASTDEWGVIKVSAMTWGEFDEDENKAVPDDQRVDPLHEIRPGDLLLSRANTSEYVGASVLVGNVRPRLLLSDKSMRLLTKDGIDRRWLRFALGSPQLRSQMSLVATGTSDSMRNISQEKVRRLAIRVPPPDRQSEIAEQIDGAVRSKARLIDDVLAARTRCRALRRAILAAAFAGRLVPQHPGDEPASVLMKRVRAERAAAGPRGRTRKAKAL